MTFPTAAPSAVPVGQPLPGASFATAISRFLRGYVVFSGRASLSEFWWAMLGTFLVSLVAQIPFWIVWGTVMVRAMDASGSTTDAAMTQSMLGMLGVLLLAIGIMLLLSLAILLPTYAVMWRRVQDAGFHGAFALLSLVGLGIVPLVMCFFPSSPAGVRFDPAFRSQLALHGQAFVQAPGQSTPYGQPTPYGEPAPYGQPTPYGQPASDRPGPYDPQPDYPGAQPR